MKKMKKVLVAAVIGLSLTTSGIAFAQSWGRHAGSGYSESQRSARPGGFMREDMVQVRIAALAEVTGQSEDTIQARLQNKPVWAVLDEFKVEFSAYQVKLQEKRAVAVRQAVTDGKITQAQADYMLARMAQAPEGAAGSRGRGSKRGGRTQGCF
jgi:hypothetical protein